MFSSDRQHNLVQGAGGEFREQYEGPMSRRGVQGPGGGLRGLEGVSGRRRGFQEARGAQRSGGGFTELEGGSSFYTETKTSK